MTKDGSGNGSEFENDLSRKHPIYATDAYMTLRVLISSSSKAHLLLEYSLKKIVREISGVSIEIIEGNLG